MKTPRASAARSSFNDHLGRAETERITARGQRLDARWKSTSTAATATKASINILHVAKGDGYFDDVKLCELIPASAGDEKLARRRCEARRANLPQTPRRACVLCHIAQRPGQHRRPARSTASRRARRREYIKESLLEPNKVLAKGFEQSALADAADGPDLQAAGTRRHPGFPPDAEVIPLRPRRSLQTISNLLNPHEHPQIQHRGRRPRLRRRIHPASGRSIRTPTVTPSASATRRSSRQSATIRASRSATPITRSCCRDPDVDAVHINSPIPDHGGAIDRRAEGRQARGLHRADGDERSRNARRSSSSRRRPD